MYYYNTILKAIYTCSFLVFGFFLFFSLFFNIQIGYFLFFNYLIIVFPLLERIFNSVLKDTVKSDLSANGINLLKYLFIMFSGLVLFFFFKVNLLGLFFFIFFLYSVLFLIDSKISFFVGFSIIIFIPIFLVLKNDFLAEKLSIYSYYFFIIGIITSIFEGIFGNKSLEN